MKYALKHARFNSVLLAVLVILLDQYSKAFFVNAALTQTFPLEILSFFNIDLVRNRGISFGLFAGSASWMPYVLMGGASLIVLGLFIWLLRAQERLMILALGIIIGGALGNILDRVRYGYVVDFLDFHLGGHHYPAFNIADSAVFIGVVILILLSIVTPENDS